MQIDSTTAAVVTGAASALGKARAMALAKAGIKIAVLDLSENAGYALGAEIGGVFCRSTF